jgi:hypothetical protein
MAKVKQHPLDVEKVTELEGCGKVLTIYSKGHHSTESFLAKLGFEFGEDYAVFYPGFEFSEKYVSQGYARVCPWVGSSHEYQYLPASKGERGAFPVTEYDFPTHLSDWYRRQKRED